MGLDRIEMGPRHVRKCGIVRKTKTSLQPPLSPKQNKGIFWSDYSEQRCRRFLDTLQKLDVRTFKVSPAIVHIRLGTHVASLFIGSFSSLIYLVNIFEEPSVKGLEFHSAGPNSKNDQFPLVSRHDTEPPTSSENQEPCFTICISYGVPGSTIYVPAHSTFPGISK